MNRRGSAPNKDPNVNVVSGMGGGGYGNPLGRASVTGPIAGPPGALPSASKLVFCHVCVGGLGRIADAGVPIALGASLPLP